MEKIKKFVFLAILGILLCMPVVAHAESYVTTLDIYYGSNVTGKDRDYASGRHGAMISVDALRDKNYKLHYDGTTTMSVSVFTSSYRLLGTDVENGYKYGVCVILDFGTIPEGYYRHYFSTIVYNDSDGEYHNYDGIKSDYVELYPKA